MDDARMKLQITNPYPARVEGTDNPMIQGAYQKWLRSGLPLDAWFDYLTKVKMFKPEMANPRGNLTGGDGMKGFGPAPLPVVDLKPSSRMPELPAAAQVGPPPLSRTPGSVPGTSSPVAKIDPASMAGPPPNPASAAPMMGLLEGSPEQQAQGRSNLPLSLGLLSFGANMFSNTNPRNHLLPYTLGEKLRDSLGAGLGTFTTFDRMMNPKQDKNFDLVEVKQGNDVVTYKKFKDGSMQQMASSPRSQAKPDGKWTTVKDPFGFGGVAQQNSVTGEIKNYHGPKVEKDAIVEDVNGYKYAKGEGGKFVRLFPGVEKEKQLIPGRDIPKPDAVQEQDIERARAGAMIINPKAQEELDRLKEQPNLTPGQKAVDTEFSKEYVNFYASGGVTDAFKNLSQLNGIADRLDAVAQGNSGENLTGPVVGRVPDFAKGFYNQEAINVRENVEEVVQRNLRVILGAQFTEKEGQRLIERAYNPNLDEAQNAKRIRRLVQAMQGALIMKKRAAEYFENNGTLKGFKGTTQFSISDFENAIGGEDAAPTGGFKYLGAE